MKVRNALGGLMSGLLLLAAGTTTSRAEVVEIENVDYINDSGNPSDGLGFLDVSFSRGLSLSAALAKAHLSYPTARLATPSEFDDLFSAAGIIYSGLSRASDGFKVGVNEQIVANGSAATIVLVGQLGGTIGAGETLIWTDPDGSALASSTRDVVRIDTFGPSGSLGRAFLQHATFQTGIPGAADYAGFLLVIAAPSNTPPTSNAGPDQSIRAGDVVFLDGSASYDDNTTTAMLEYEWLIISQPVSSVAVLNDTSSMMPMFVADVAGTYRLALVVADEEGLKSEPAFVSISSDNLAPTAVATASATLAVVGSVVVFDGANSFDPEFDEITYAWEITSAPLGSAASLVGGETASPSMIPDLPGVYEVSLVVSDFLGPGLPTSVELTATTAEGFAEFLILEVSAQVAALSADQVTTKGNQTALGQHLANAIRDLQEGKTADAIDKLNKAIERTDGCPLRGAPDGNGKGRDWIIDCDAQYDIYDALKLAVETLEPDA